MPRPRQHRPDRGHRARPRRPRQLPRRHAHRRLGRHAGADRHAGRDAAGARARAASTSPPPVSRPETIARAPAGSGAEAYPGYAPSPTRGGTTLSGEARVSRHIVSALVRPCADAVRAAAARAGDRCRRPPGGRPRRRPATRPTWPSPPRPSGGTLPYRPTATGSSGTERPLLRVPVGVRRRRPDPRRPARRRARRAGRARGRHRRARHRPDLAVRRHRPRRSRCSGCWPASRPTCGPATRPRSRGSGRPATASRWTSSRARTRSSCASSARAPCRRRRWSCRSAPPAPPYSGTTAPLVLQGDGRRVAVPGFRDRIEIQIQAASS